MLTRRYELAEARRLLPELVRSIAEQGGRIAIDYQGEPRVTLLRTAELPVEGHAPSEPPQSGARLAVSAEDIDRALRRFHD